MDFYIVTVIDFVVNVNWNLNEKWVKVHRNWTENETVLMENGTN